MLYENGEEISLPPKTVEVLIVLVERCGNIVSKDELMNKVWADTIVEESNISQCLYHLRKVLGNRANGKPFIETFRRRGYRFNCDDLRVIEETFAEADQTPTSDFVTHHETGANGSKPTDSGMRLSFENKYEAEQLRKPLSKSAKSSFIIIPVIVLGLLFVTLSFLWLKPALFTSSKKRGDLTFIRLTNGISALDATISPDGKYFVYHEYDGNMTHLWLQQTGQASRVEIVPASKKLIGGKTFSPDGTFIYFTAQEDVRSTASLYRVPTLGGAQSKILDNVDSPVSFSPDGSEMVFTRRNQETGESSLVVAASDGSRERILQSRKEKEGIMYNPAWSPDGKTIAFGLVEPKKGFCTLLRMNLQTGATKELSSEKWDNCYRMAYTKDGKGLIFIGTKLGEGLTTRRDQVYYIHLPTGEAHRLTFEDSRHQTLSLGITDDDEILIVPFDRSSQIWVMSSDGDAKTAVQLTNGLADGRAGLVPLRDGRVAYVARIGDYLSGWMMNADGSNQRQFINNPPLIEELRAPLDGSFFVFLARRDEYMQVFRVDADGSNLQQLTFDERHSGDATVSPDGKWIIYFSQVQNEGTEKYALYKIPSSGGEPILFSNLSCIFPHFSPDGSLVSCVRSEREILVLAADSGNLMKTFEAVEVPSLNIGARWTPDGQNLVYIVHQKNVSNLWLQPIKGGAPRQLTNFTSGKIYNFAFSADGSRIYLARGSYQKQDVVLIKNLRQVLDF